jgi:bacteriocin-like protein
MHELTELTDCELDAVSGGNPFSINLSGISARVFSTISLALSTSFANAPALAQTNTSDQHVSITGDGAA